MSTKKMMGIHAAIVTPMHEDESINYDSLQRIIEYLVQGGIHGVLVGGNTGEFPLLDKDERKELIKRTCEFSNGRLQVTTCCSMNTTKQTLEMTEFANSAGVDYVMLAMPYDMPTTFDGIYEYVKTIADASDAGICLYHYPSYTHVHLTPEQMSELASIENVAGSKDVVDVDELMELLYLNNKNGVDDFGILCAYDRQLVPAMAGGCEGLMGVAPAIAPANCRKIYDLMLEGKVKEARELSFKMEHLYDVIFNKAPFPGGMKNAFNLLGIPVGIPRKPLEAVDSSSDKEVLAAFEEAGISL